MYRIQELQSLSECAEAHLFSNMSETELYHYNEPKEGLFVAESPNVILRALEAGYEPICLLTDRKYLNTQAVAVLEALQKTEREVPVYAASQEELQSQVTGYEMTRGMWCLMERKKQQPIDELLEGAKRIVVLENVMNPTNVGAIFRNAAALGMDAVLLTEGSSDPFYRRAARVSMGTVFQIPWAFLPGKWSRPGKPDYIGQLRDRFGFYSVAMALRDDTKDIDDPGLSAREKLAVIMGSEGPGLSQETICACDATVKIPMSHRVDSLNVAAAAAIAFWTLGNRSRNQ